MSTAEHDRRIVLAQSAVAAQIPLFDTGFGAVKSNWKSDGTRVTPADVTISKNLQDAILQEFPSDQFFSEELVDPGEIDVTSRFSWILDPIDGTNNFALGIPNCAIALALCEDGEPIYGVIYDYGRRRILRGGPGHGLWDGAHPAVISQAEPGNRAIIGFHSPVERGRYPGHAEALVSIFKIRALGSSTLHLAYTAAGLLDGTVDHNVRLWDIAAAIPMVRAAGGEVRFLGASPLPLRRFSTAMDRIFYVAGSTRMCDGLEAALK